MELFLIRHAIAEEPQHDRPDAARAVTRRGRERFRGAVRGLAELGVRLDHVIHSPLLRAVQTAEYLTPLLDGQTEVSDLLAQIPSDKRAPGANLPFKKGGVAWLVGDPLPGEMSLRAFLPPGVLRRIAGER